MWLLSCRCWADWPVVAVVDVVVAVGLVRWVVAGWLAPSGWSLLLGCSCGFVGVVAFGFAGCSC